MFTYGNYCGPWWSDGKRQVSVVGTTPPMDELDAECMRHDAAYAMGDDLRKADLAFARSTIGRGPLSTAMGLAVGLQGILRPRDSAASTLSTMPRQRAPTPKPKQRTTPRMVPTQSTTTNQRMRGNNSVTAAPVALATRRTGSKPKMSTSNGGVVTVGHRSFLAAVENSINFSVIQYPVNPGMAGTFPWLSKLARKYEQFKFKRLRFEFRSVTASSTPGVVMMSFDYDAADTAPASKAEQAQTIPNSESNVWMNNDLVIPVDSTWKYVRSGALAANLDIKTYDMGTMNLSSVYGDGVVGGELYVEYEVELRRPTDGPESSGVLTANTGAAFVNPFVTNVVSKGVAYPFRRISATELSVVAGGEYFCHFAVFGIAITGAPPFPDVISPSATSVVSELSANFSNTQGTNTFRLRVDTGDVLKFNSLGSGATTTAIRLYAAAADYASL